MKVTVKRINNAFKLMIMGIHLLWKWLGATMLVTITTLTWAFIRLSDEDAAKLAEQSLYDAREIIGIYITLVGLIVLMVFIFYATYKYFINVDNSSQSDMESHQKNHS